MHTIENEMREDSGAECNQLRKRHITLSRRAIVCKEENQYEYIQSLQSIALL